jgi:hypothetical protein
MHILIHYAGKLPIEQYSGTEQIVASLGKSLIGKGHQVTYLVKKKSTCDFAKVMEWDEKIALEAQIPADIDVVHTLLSTKIS